MMDAMVSPLRGADGNVEFLVHVRRPELGRDLQSAAVHGRAPDLDALVAEAAGDPAGGT